MWLHAWYPPPWVDWTDFVFRMKGGHLFEVLDSLQPSLCQCLVEWKTLLRHLGIRALLRGRLSPHLRSVWVERQGPHTPPRNIYLSSWLDGLNDHPAERGKWRWRAGGGGEGRVKFIVEEMCHREGEQKRGWRVEGAYHPTLWGKSNSKNDLASHIYPRLWQIWLWLCLLSAVGVQDTQKHTHACAHAIKHAHTMTYIHHIELINFLTHLQKFISKTECICSCKCDEKPLNAQISEASGKYFSITHSLCQFNLALNVSIFHTTRAPGASAAGKGQHKVILININWS